MLSCPPIIDNSIDGAAPTPEIANAEYHRRRQRVFVLQRRHQHHQILAIMRALNSPLVPLPLIVRPRIRPIPRMGPRRHLLCFFIQPTDQRIPQPRIPIQRGVVLHSHMNRQSFRQQDLRRHAVHIPRVPSPRQPLLHVRILRRPGCYRISPRRNVRSRTLPASRCNQQPEAPQQPRESPHQKPF
jgi:hypothetical protein